VIKDPAFLFYSSDFLNGIADLTMEERGQYITLLCLQHQKGYLTDKTIRLSVGSVSVDVMVKFQLSEDGNYYNSRLSTEIEKRRFFTDSRRENGLKGGRPNASGKPSGKPSEEPSGKPNGLPRDNHIEDENINEDISIKNEIILKMLIPEMLKVWLTENPTYPQDLEKDSHALLQLAYRIAEFKGWKKADAIDVKKLDVIKSWGKIVKFISSDNWYSTKPLSVICNQWQGIVQQMTKVNPKEMATKIVLK